jgi:hypothetical protein
LDFCYSADFVDFPQPPTEKNSVLSKFIKTAKYLADWLDWALIYPLWQTKSGREQIITILLPYVKNNPTKVWEMRQMAVKAMGEMYMNKIFAGFGYPEPGNNAEDVLMGNGHQPPAKTNGNMTQNGVDFMPPAVVENPEIDPNAHLPRQEMRGVHNYMGKVATPLRDMFDLKRRLGLRKS